MFLSALRVSPARRGTLGSHPPSTRGPSQSPAHLPFLSAVTGGHHRLGLLREWSVGATGVGVGCARPPSKIQVRELRP